MMSSIYGYIRTREKKIQGNYECEDQSANIKRGNQKRNSEIESEMNESDQTEKEKIADSHHETKKSKEKLGVIIIYSGRINGNLTTEVTVKH